MVFVIYKTDVWHTYESRDIIGIATNKYSAMELIYKQAEKDGDTITSDQHFNLENYKQTQGHEGEYEFQYEEVETDTLL